MRTIILLCIVALLLMSCSDNTAPKYTVPTPTFSPAGGTYSSTQTVSIFCGVSNAEVRYTLDGTDPGANSPIYTAPLEISATTVLKARGYKSKYKPSQITTGTFNFSVGTIYITPLGGTFCDIQDVTIITATPGTAIHYTLDGTDPTVESPLYGGVMHLDGNAVVKAKGFIEGWTPSNTVTANFVFQPAQPLFNYGEGTYYSQLSLAMTTTTAGAAIHYTTNDTEPTETSTIYTMPLNINQNITVRAKAFKNNWTPSATTAAEYILKPAAPVYNPLPATFNSPQKISINCNTPEASIYYTTNGIDPTQTSTPYTTPVYLAMNTTLKARAYIPNWTPSNGTSGNYNFVAAAPVFDPPTGVYTEVQNVTITSATKGADIRYTTDNTEPIPTSPLYTAPLTISATTILKARAYKTGMVSSQTVSALYQIVNVVATPTFDPPAGVYYTPTEVTITCATSGASIHYTTDGSDPNSSSGSYTGPITITETITIRAKAFKSGWNPSATANGAYSIESTDQIAAWGANSYNQCNVPIGNDFAQIDAGMYHSVGLRIDGSLVAWGRNNNEQCNYPTGNDYIAVSAGDNHSLALKADGTIVAWGLNDSLQCDVPDSLDYTYTAISAGGNHSIALTSTGILVAWGSNSDGQCDVPTGNTFTKVSAGQNHNIALRANGTIVAWGNNDNGQINAPTGSNYVDIAAGSQHCIAKRSTGVLIGWGSNSDLQTVCPVGTDFVKISAGYRHNLALRSNGTIASWGYGGGGLSDVPASNTFIAISAGRDFSLGLKNADARNKSIRHNTPKWKFKK